MQRSIHALGLAFLVAFAPRAVQAQQIVVEIDDSLARQAGLDPNALRNALGGAVSDDLNLSEVDPYLESMAISSLLATKGMGVDYATNPKVGVLGWSIGTAVDAGGFRFGKGGEDLPEFGYSFQTTAMAGLNLGAIFGKDTAWNRFMLYVNGMQLDTQGDIFDASLTNLGGHLQIKLIKVPSQKVVEWGGLDLTTGYELSVYTMELGQGLNVAVPDYEGVTWKGTGDFSLSSSSTSIPIELSTNVRLLVLTVFGGAGVDITEGSSTLSAALGGDVVAEYGGKTFTVGSVSVSDGTEGLAPSVFPRAFVGAQINILPVKLYGQLSAGMERGVGGQLGVRLAY